MQEDEPSIIIIAQLGTAEAELIVGDRVCPIRFDPEPFGGYTVRIPAISAFTCYGETLDEAHERLEDAFDRYLEELEARGEPLRIEAKHTRLVDPEDDEDRNEEADGTPEAPRRG